MRACLLSILVAALAGARTESLAGDADAPAAGLEQEYAGHAALFGADTNYMVRDGLLANRREQWVRILGRGVGINPNEPVEFFLISDDSGHDYEALAISFARPIDIHRALEFIGLPPGRPVDYEKLQMWPKGERVNATFEWDETAGGEPVRRRIPAEHLIVDARTGRTLPEMGFAFVGSVRVPAAEPGDAEVYAAEAYDPHAIMADYNERLSVLDVPRKAVDGEVYGYQRANPDLRLPAGGLVEVVFEAEKKNGQKRIVDLTLTASPKPKRDGAMLADMQFDLRGADGTQAGRGPDLKHFLAALSRLQKQGQDAFITLVPSDDLPLAGVRALSSFLESIATDNGIRLEPPPEGHLFYKSFLPQESFRQRETRPSQPWELHLDAGAGGLTGVLVRIDETWTDEAEVPELTSTDFEVSAPPDVSRILAENGPGIPVVLLFAPSSATYGQIVSYARAAIASHPTIYVFPSDEMAPKP